MTATRARLLMLIGLAAAYSSLETVTGATLTAVVYDAMSWSIPAPVHMAVAELREQGHEIRLVDVDVENGDGQTPAELRQLLTAAKQHGLPAIAFQSGSRVSAADVPTTKDDFIRAVQ